MTVIVPDSQRTTHGNFDPAASLTPRPWLWPVDTDVETCWSHWAADTAKWLDEVRIPAREALVIVPVGALLSHARQAWARTVGGWAPTIETVASLISGNSWLSEPSPRQTRITGDPIADKLKVSRLLLTESWCKQWAARDPRGFEYATQQIVAIAHTWVKRAQALHPSRRAEYWQKTRTILATHATQPLQFGSREKLLLAWALEWVIDSFEGGWPSDVVFDLPHKAIVGISAGRHVAPGTEASLMLSLMAHARESRDCACRWDIALPGEGVPSAEAAPAIVACRDSEDEAQRAAAVVLDAVASSRQKNELPVALIALDRSLIRRIRAILEGSGARMADETGWRLSTTRACAVMTRLLAAANAQASSDDLLDWLKSGWVELPELPACDALEAWCRQHNWLRAWDCPAENRSGTPCSDAAIALWNQAQEATRPLRTLASGKRKPLRSWVAALRTALEASGAWTKLTSDEAGSLAAQSLHLQDSMSCDEDWNHLLDDMLVDNAGFVRWVREILESTTFRPSPPQDRVDVVITPMARAVLRPFHAIVMPGADAKQLGSVSTDTGWLGASLSRSMHLATPEDLRMAQWDAFGLLMTRRFVTCLRRQGHGSEPIAESPWLKQWARERGISWLAKPIPWRDHAEAYQPIKMPAPALIPARRELLPSFLSATSYEALRQCPYRFFAQSILRLRETEELEEGIDRSDYGIWLHEVIRQYHTEREQMLAMRTEEEEVDAWLETAERVMRDLGLNDDATRPYFQPYKASLPMMASAYVAWLLEHEKKGWHCVANESGSALDLPLHDVDAQIRLTGQIDRIDARYEDQRRIRMVIDYKTGSLSNLKEKTKNPQEDTQLPFYAAMAGADVSEAAYLHIDGKAVTLLPHPDVQEHADALIAGIQQDMARIFEGAPMPALGEGSACTYCPARGLCRKDHWEAAMASEGAA